MLAQKRHVPQLKKRTDVDIYSFMLQSCDILERQKNTEESLFAIGIGEAGHLRPYF